MQKDRIFKNKNKKLPDAFESNESPLNIAMREMIDKDKKIIKYVLRHKNVNDALQLKKLIY